VTVRSRSDRHAAVRITGAAQQRRAHVRDAALMVMVTLRQATSCLAAALSRTGVRSPQDRLKKLIKEKLGQLRGDSTVNTGVNAIALNAYRGILRKDAFYALPDCQLRK
jgi:hypothetical protein